jgi:hypothetical protein
MVKNDHPRLAHEHDACDRSSKAGSRISRHCVCGSLLEYGAEVESLNELM